MLFWWGATLKHCLKVMFPVMWENFLKEIPTLDGRFYLCQVDTNREVIGTETYWEGKQPSKETRVIVKQKVWHPERDVMTA